MALRVFLRILFAELAVLILTNKGFLKTISWHIMQLIKAKCHETKTQYRRRKWVFRVLKNAYTQQNFLRTHKVAWIKELFSLKVDFHGRFH